LQTIRVKKLLSKEEELEVINGVIIANRQLTVTEYFEELMVFTRGLLHRGLAIYNKKYLKAKEEL
jgi:hypothetical protein